MKAFLKGFLGLAVLVGSLQASPKFAEVDEFGIWDDYKLKPGTQISINEGSHKGLKLTLHRDTKLTWTIRDQKVEMGYGVVNQIPGYPKSYDKKGYMMFGDPSDGQFYLLGEPKNIGDNTGACQQVKFVSFHSNGFVEMLDEEVMVCAYAKDEL